MTVKHAIELMFKKLEADCGYPNFDVHINLIERDDVKYRINVMKYDFKMLIVQFKNIFKNIFVVIKSILEFILNLFLFFINILLSIFKHYKHVKIVNRIKNDSRFFEIVKKNDVLKKNVTVIK